jgi:hypothetical protein
MYANFIETLCILYKVLYRISNAERVQKKKTSRKTRTGKLGERLICPSCNRSRFVMTHKIDGYKEMACCWKTTRSVIAVSCFVLFFFYFLFLIPVELGTAAAIESHVYWVTPVNPHADAETEMD